MKCPYCNKETKTGWLKSPSEIIWSEKKTKFRASQWDDLMVAQSLFTVENVPAEYCEACKKIIVHLDKERKINR